MSWQAYVDNLLQSGKADQAALFGRAGDSLWASSPGFDVSAPEMQTIAGGFDNPDEVQASGIRVNGDKYFLLRVDDKSLHAKLGETGVIAVRTQQAIVLIHYSAPVLAGEANAVVVALADYLSKAGY